MISLSVILINNNRGFSLEHAINAILPQLRECDELIVVDDNSDDNSLELLECRKEHFKHFFKIDSKGNRSMVRNCAAKAAVNDILVFIDSDVVIGPHNLEETRKIHEDITVAGLNGLVFGNDHDVLQFELLAQKKLTDFVKLVEEDFNILFQYERFFDYRYVYKHVWDDDKQNWKHYFTSYATARRDIFERIGGFDENFTVWGVEDMELGYRLNLHGRIVGSDKIISFHYPHVKNHFNNAMNNIQNMYYIFCKYQTYELEVALAYHMGFPEPYKLWLRNLIDNIAKVNRIESVNLKRNEAAIYFSDMEHKNGYIEVMKDDGLKGYDLFGITLPFKDKSLERIYISPYYTLLPESIMATIVQEAIRVSKLVLMPKKGVASEVPIPDELKGRSFYMYNEIMAVALKMKYFNISSYDDKYYSVETKSDAAFYPIKTNKYYSV